MEREETAEEKRARADHLEAQAKTNDAYMQKMEQTTERTNGMLGHLNAPNSYAAHVQAAARKREQAARLRAEADESPTQKNIMLTADYRERITTAAREASDTEGKRVSESEIVRRALDAFLRGGKS